MSKATKNAAKKNGSKSAKAAPKATRKDYHGAEAINANRRAKRAAKAAAPAKANGQIEDVYRTGGGYWSSVKALRTLGVGKLHSFDAIVAAVRKVMTEAGTYKAFAAKEARNEKTSKDTTGRILQNVAVTARVKDYGKPLTERKYVVKYDGREKKAGLFKM